VVAEPGGGQRRLGSQQRGEPLGETGGAATSYIVEAGSSSGASNVAVIDTQSAAPTFVATGVGSGRYFVRVRGFNAAGVGPASNETVVIVP